MLTSKVQNKNRVNKLQNGKQEEKKKVSETTHSEIKREISDSNKSVGEQDVG